MLVAGVPRERYVLAEADAAGSVIGRPETVTPDGLAEAFAGRDADHRRWVFDDVRRWYPAIVAAGVRLTRCHDLRLCRAILAGSELSPGLAGTEFSVPDVTPSGPPALFGNDGGTALDDVESELRRQVTALADADEPWRLRLLCAAESAGGLLGVEMTADGVPWRADVHDALLKDALGPRPAPGYRPAGLEALAANVRSALDAPELNPDSPAEVLKALQYAGLRVETTRSWELKRLTHPAIAPLLEYKKLSRLMTANGWAWLDEWVSDGRFRPEYVPGGASSGRWAANGGGALQIPAQVRPAVRADDGWKLVVADAAQLEPRVLAALSGDSAMMEAGRERDLYAGIAAQGFGGDRAHAKVAMLGAIYGSTTGESGRLMPQLRRTFPRAVGYVEDAARTGERGGIVTTRLGRSCPPAGDDWAAMLRTVSAEEERRAVGIARSRGRFTRNFVIQGSAADWALCWLAELRSALRRISDEPRLVFFLHDEVMVHCPAGMAGQVAEAIDDAAAAATHLMFGDIPVTFPLTTSAVDAYSDAK
nr:bifunctional 3'-5' exonuclease/DNA polymerase [Spelaeicoccus albus]